MPTLQNGDTAPTFDLIDQDEQQVRSEDFNGRYLFVFFYPKANTSG